MSVIRSYHNRERLIGLAAVARVMYECELAPEERVVAYYIADNCNLETIVSRSGLSKAIVAKVICQLLLDGVLGEDRSTGEVFVCGRVEEEHRSLILPHESKPVFVYLMKSGSRYKIGVSIDPESRVKQLSTASPLPVELVASRRYDTAYEVEQALHERYNEYRVIGEWFELPKIAADNLAYELGNDNSRVV